MEPLANRSPSPLAIARLVLLAFVLAWLFGPYALQSAVPIWLPFLIALGLELHFVAGAFRPSRAQPPDRRPQAVDVERYGYPEEADELLLVREGDEELWIPYTAGAEEDVEALIAEARERPVEEAAPVEDADERRRPPLRRFLPALGVIGLLALILWVAEGRTGWSALDESTRAATAARLSDEASVVAAKPVTIRCDDAGDHVGAVQHADGVAVVGGDLAYLTPERCLALYRLAFEGEVTSSQTGRALAVLAHETWHLRGVSDEATTECYALQTGVEIGRRLGLSDGTARQLMRQQLVENALHASNPEYLVSPECRDGGGLDLDPRSSRFP